MKIKYTCKCGKKIEYMTGIRESKQELGKPENMIINKDGDAEEEVEFVVEESKCECGHAMCIPRLK